MLTSASGAKNCKFLVIKDLMAFHGQFFKKNIHSFIYNAKKMHTDCLELQVYNAQDIEVDFLK